MLLLLALLSGLGGVVYEVLYMRELTVVLGDMFYVHVSLVGMFLLANGIGAALAHRFLRYLFAFEIAIGVYALAFPSVLDLYVGSPVAHLFVSPVAQTLFASALLLAVPALCVGFSIPLFSAYVRAQGRTQDAFKLTYLLYNVGAAVSILLVEFQLIRWIGLASSLYLVGCANLAAGLLLVVGRRHYSLPAPEPAATARRFGWHRGMALLLASTAAAIFLGFYIKVCYHLFLPQRENFAICTALSVLAISVGTALVQRRRLDFATALVLAGLTLVPIFAALGGVAAAFHALGGGRGGVAPLPWIILLGFVLVIPYVFLGATIPALLRDESDVARSSGRALLISGIGNAVGLLGFTLIHPRFALFTIPLAIWALLLVACLVHGGLSRRHLAALAVSAAILPVLHGRSEDLVYLVSWPPPADAEVSHFKAASDNVSYVSAPSESYIVYNGHPAIPVETPRGVWNAGEVMVGILPALVAPRLDAALVLGLGTGLTAGTTATLFGRTDIVEINAAFFDLAPILREGNSSVLANPAARIFHDDARRFLSAPPRRYDAIVSSVSSPTYFSAGKIYTSEFFRMVTNALAPDGVFSSWFAVGSMSRRGVMILLATVSDHFDYCNLAVLRSRYYLMSCSNAPVSIRDPAETPIPRNVETLLEDQLRGVSVDDFLRNVFISDNIFGQIDFSPIPRNTDDFPILEFELRKFSRKGRARSAVVDPVSTRPDSFNVSLRVGEDGGASMTRALVLYQIYSPLFDRFYEPWLAEDGSRRTRFRARLGLPPE
jgi:predicted membrane-bound spermidine synthase